MKEDREHKIINKILSSTQTKAPVDMSDRVLAGLRSEKETVYRPLLPKWFWWLSGILCIALVHWTLQDLAPSSKTVLSPIFDKVRNGLSFDIPKPKPILIYSTASIGLMIFLNTVLVSRKNWV